MKKKKKRILVYASSQKNSSKKSFRLFLKRNKIYFETIVMLIASIAGIFISIAGVQVSIMANDISANEQRIEDLEKQPYFILETEVVENKDILRIKNVGGDIKSGSVFIDKIFYIVIRDEYYGYVGSGYIFLSGYRRNNYSRYDNEKKCFEIQNDLESKSILELEEKIENIIHTSGYFYGIDCTEYFEFSYVDYKNELINREMLMNGGLITDIENDSKPDFKIIVNLNDYNDEYIEKELKENLNLLLKYKGN